MVNNDKVRKAARLMSVAVSVEPVSTQAAAEQSAITLLGLNDTEAERMREVYATEYAVDDG